MSYLDNPEEFSCIDECEEEDEDIEAEEGGARRRGTLMVDEEDLADEFDCSLS